MEEESQHIVEATDHQEKKKTRILSRGLPSQETAFGCPRDFLENRFVYVVVSARARGLSVGVNMNPDKECNFECAYCEVHRSDPPRVSKLDVDAMAAELKRTLNMVREGRLRERPWYRTLPDELLQLRHVALSGDGEPTTAPDCAESVQAVVHVRALGGYPFFKLVLLTNATGLDQAQVQQHVGGEAGHGDREGRTGVLQAAEHAAAAPGIVELQPTWVERIALGREEVRSILGRIWPYLLAGIALGAAIHGWVPTNFFTHVAGPGNPLAVPIAVILGLPFYSNAAGTLPLIEAVHAKGMAMGTSLALMMSIVALSLPEMILLRRVLKPRLLAIYVGIVASGIVAIGFLFNAVI